ncbi:MAG: CPBP family glutamic-type intramembrane protease [Cyanobacteria bacterium J06597_16]
MTLKRIVLSILTFIVALEMGASLISSLGEPQVGNQLQLYQTDLMVQASEWNGSGLPEQEVEQFRKAVFGEDALVSATEQYQEVRKESATGLVKLQKQLTTVAQTSGDSAQPLRLTAQTQQKLIDQIDLRLGMVQVQQGAVDKGLETWQTLADKGAATNSRTALTATTLADLWREPAVVQPQAENVINENLRGWYRTCALKRLYVVNGEESLLNELKQQDVSLAERTLIQLSVVGLLPSFGGLLGAAGLIALIGQRVLRGRESLLAVPEDQWTVPWTWETIWQVVVGGFLFVGQIALPLLLQIGLAARSAMLTPEIAVVSGGLAVATGLGSTGFGSVGLGITDFGTGLSYVGWAIASWISPEWVLGLSSRGKALSSLVFYVLMALSTLGVLYWSIKPYLPLPKDWFRVKLAGRWPLWGFGSYLVALPLMLGISVLNQQIWQGQGGNNPILQLVLEERDPVALGLFLFTAAIAAPVFEEILFRGFILPSLTRYMPIWGAIGLSSLIFSVAHLSFSEVLPLTVLGAILGFVYVRSQNLLASILLHSTWNSITMIGLFLLGSGG